MPPPIGVETERPDGLVLVSFNANVTDDEFRAYLQQVSDRLALQRPFGFVYITTSNGSATATQRRMQAGWNREHFVALRTWVWGSAFVVVNPIHRLTLASVLALQRLPYPYTVVATPEQALAWTLAQRDTPA